MNTLSREYNTNGRFGKHNAPIVQWILLADIQPNLLQPIIRTSDAQMRKLRQSMSTNAGAVTIRVCRTPKSYKDKRPYTNCDGHRRLEIMRMDGADGVYCEVLSGDPCALFVVLNSGNEPFTATTWWTIWSLAAPAARPTLGIPSGVLKQINNLARWVGSEEEVAEWGKRTVVTPYYVQFPMRMLEAAATNRNKVSRTTVLHKYEHRRIASEIFESSFRRGGLKDTVRKQIVKWCLTTARRAGIGTIDGPPPTTTWEGCGARVFRREVEKILRGDVLNGKKEITLAQ